MLHTFTAHRVFSRRTSSTLKASSTAWIESLERRVFLSVTISGSVKQDITGNGLSGDDTPLAGVTVKLYNDANGNGQLDAIDGASISTRISAAGTGAFSFTGLGTGKYLLVETPGANQVRTNPDVNPALAINATNPNGTYANNIFTNYVKDFDPSAIVSYSYLINGTTVVSKLDGNVNEGDTVQVNFTVAAGKTVRLSLVVYHTHGPAITDQDLHDSDTGLFTAGTHSLTVTVPDCKFQIDFVGGLPINPFVGGGIGYGAQGRLIDFENGGIHECEHEETGGEGLTLGFWKNHTALWVGLSPNQTLESVFDVPDSLGLDNKTLLEALNFGGGPGVLGAAKNLFRQAVAALLNAHHPLVEYALTSTSIVTQVNAALASGNASTIGTLKDLLDDLNNAGGGIDAHGNPI